MYFNRFIFIFMLVLYGIPACEVEQGLVSNISLFQSGTLSIWPRTITDEDTYLYLGNIPTGQRDVIMYSRLLESWITVPAWTYDAYFDDQATIECCVNALEFSYTKAQSRFVIPTFHHLVESPLRSGIMGVM